MGLVMKVDRRGTKPPCASAITPRPLPAPTWAGASRSPRDEFKPGYLAEFDIKEVDKKAVV